MKNTILLEDFSNDKIKGGVGDNHSFNEVDEKELEMGIEVEMEHTDDKEIAKEIALDHLIEDPKYYTKLKTIHID